MHIKFKSFHPTINLLATASGQRKIEFPINYKQSTSNSSSDSDEDLTSVQSECSLKIWKHNL